MILKNSKILVVAAHPDDDLLGCGGTLIKALSLKASIKILFLGEGVSSRFDFFVDLMAYPGICSRISLLGWRQLMSFPITGLLSLGKTKP